MKKISLLLFVIATFIVTSCTDKESYTINGKIVGEYEGQQVYLQKINQDGSGFSSSDTAIVKDGAFVFKGKAGIEPEIRFVSLANNGVRPTLVILEAGKIELTIDSVTTVKGTPQNDKYQEFSNKSQELGKKLDKLGQEYQKASNEGTLTPELDKKINDEYDVISKELSTQIYDYTKSNITNPVGEFFFLTVGSSLENDQLKELLGLARPEFKKDEKIKRLEEHLALLDNSTEGKQFIDVKGLSPQGKEIALSDYAGKGNYVLIDFWASWCGPCIQEMPNVVDAYAKYKAKGFEIVGISLDDNKEKWENKIKELRMTWPQMSDLKGWQSELSAPYGVSSIPHTILLDKEGKIIAKNLRGEELLNKLAELMP